MPSHLLIEVPHGLSPQAARILLGRWLAKGREDWGLTCDLSSGEGEDLVTFHRAGLQGRLTSNVQGYALSLELGFLLTAFKGQIENKIRANLAEDIASMRS